eukprot:GHVU01064964.1.p1 GENE.GHVU01064964.1~~GHVU01064964.1.p1  ORF type:complete len:115 (+),score=10.26 GHVU01064964.1:147-491(+)
MNRREESQEQETAGITAANEVNESSWSGIWYGASAPDSSQGSLLLEQPGLPSGSAVAGQQQLAASRIANVSGSISSSGPVRWLCWTQRRLYSIYEKVDTTFWNVLPRSVQVCGR